MDLGAIGQRLSFLVPAFVLGVIASGLYMLVPGLAYALVGVGGACLFLNRPFASSPLKFIGQERLAGFAIFNVFFFLHSLPHLQPLQSYEAVRTLFLHVLSIGMYLFAIAFGRLFLTQSTYAVGPVCRERLRWLCAVLSLAVLAALLLTQIGQLIPAFKREAHSLADVVYILSRRPGGLFNPNMTAAIALICLFIAHEGPSQGRQSLALAPIVALATVVIVLSQSRVGVAVLLTYGFFALPRRAFVMTILLMAAAICLAFLIELETGRLALKLLRRLAGDYSSQERIELFKHGLAAFTDAPFLGKGYRYVALTTGQSTHNQIVEILASFGLAGLAAIGLASYLLYWGGSARFLLVCVAPTFLFSHNFYETVSFQAALGLALAVDKSRDAVAPRDESG
jgi:O-antigen ligase